VKVLTPLTSPDSAAIGFVTIAGLDPARLQAWLLTQHRIVTTLIVHPQFSGLRITPNVYTTPAEIDIFTAQVSAAIRSGLT
jgi:isopenicillin-N epimerase